MEHRSQRVMIETLRHRIVGDVMLPAAGYRSRLSDFLNSAEREFVPLVNCVVQTLEEELSYERDFLAVSRQHIVLAMQTEQRAPPGTRPSSPPPAG
jgi:hypothetical protein